MGSTSFFGFFYPNLLLVFLNLLFFRNLCSSERFNNRFIHVGVDTSRYALLIGGRSSYPPYIS